MWNLHGKECVREKEILGFAKWLFDIGISFNAIRYDKLSDIGGGIQILLFLNESFELSCGIVVLFCCAKLRNTHKLLQFDIKDWAMYLCIWKER